MISPPLRQVLREPPGLQKRWDASSPDQPNGEIDFHAWLRVRRFLYQNAGLSVGKRTGENQLKLISELRCFCLLLRATLIFGGLGAAASGLGKMKNMIAFFNSRGDGIIHSLSFQGISEAA